MPRSRPMPPAARSTPTLRSSAFSSGVADVGAMATLGIRTARPAVAANPQTARARVGDGLSKIVNSRAAGAAPTPVEKPELLQGYLEGSNVTPLREMVDLVLISRAYEANQKMITTVDEQTQKALDALG